MTPLYEEFQYNTGFPQESRNKSIIRNSELSLNFEISHGKYNYKSNNFLQEKRELVRL
jgi:hypothetical protein